MGSADNFNSISNSLPLSFTAKVQFGFLQISIRITFIKMRVRTLRKKGKKQKRAKLLKSKPNAPVLRARPLVRDKTKTETLSERLSKEAF